MRQPRCRVPKIFLLKYGKYPAACRVVTPPGRDSGTVAAGPPSRFTFRDFVKRRPGTVAGHTSPEPSAGTPGRPRRDRRRGYIRRHVFSTPARPALNEYTENAGKLCIFIHSVYNGRAAARKIADFFTFKKPEIVYLPIFSRFKRVNGVKVLRY